MATEDSSIDTNAQTATPGRGEAPRTPSSWSAPPRASSRWRGVLITCGVLALWLVLFLLMVSPVLLDLWRGRSAPSSAVKASPAASSTSSSSHSSSSQSRLENR